MYTKRGEGKRYGKSGEEVKERDLRPWLPANPHERKRTEASSTYMVCTLHLHRSVCFMVHTVVVPFFPRLLYNPCRHPAHPTLHEQVTGPPLEKRGLLDRTDRLVLRIHAGQGFL